MKEFNGVKVDFLGHASVKVENGLTVYIDPWSEVIDEYVDADIIVSTHSHRDHFDIQAIERLSNEDTVLLCTKESEEDVPASMKYEIIAPGETVEVRGVKFQGFDAYNIDKYRSEDEPFHPKGLCVGVVFELNGKKIYHASDTDPVPEMTDIAEEDIDLAFLPIGGKYTMNQEEALEAVEMIDPETVVPIHYGVIEGTEADPEEFKTQCSVPVKIL